MITLCAIRTEKRKYVITTTDAKHKYKEYPEVPDEYPAIPSLGYSDQQHLYSKEQEEIMARTQAGAAQAQSTSPFYMVDPFGRHGNVLGGIFFP